MICRRRISGIIGRSANVLSVFGFDDDQRCLYLEVCSGDAKDQLLVDLGETRRVLGAKPALIT